MKNIGKIALTSLLALMLNGDANISNQNYRNSQKDKGGLTTEERKTKKTWKDLENLGIEKYLEDTNIESLYSKGHLSKDYYTLQSNARKEGNFLEVDLLHSEALMETRKHYIDFIYSGDLSAAPKALATGYAAMLVSPNSPFNDNIVDRLRAVCSRLDSLQGNPR